jgi:hypothetical protein
MRATTLPPRGGEDNHPPVPLFVEVDASLLAVRVEPDHEHGLVEIHLAAWTRAWALLGPENALQLASPLVRR